MISLRIAALRALIACISRVFCVSCSCANHLFGVLCVFELRKKNKNKIVSKDSVCVCRVSASARAACVCGVCGVSCVV
jgi:1-aminocyclopropane-1-carboxylate deaminase/D-cysteine desulfhydrase-like pyridoxal-dependent ACC family enzyme